MRYDEHCHNNKMTSHEEINTADMLRRRVIAEAVSIREAMLAATTHEELLEASARSSRLFDLHSELAEQSDEGFFITDMMSMSREALPLTSGHAYAVEAVYHFLKHIFIPDHMYTAEQLNHIRAHVCYNTYLKKKRDAIYAALSEEKRVADAHTRKQVMAIYEDLMDSDWRLAEKDVDREFIDNYFEQLHTMIQLAEPLCASGSEMNYLRDAYTKYSGKSKFTFDDQLQLSEYFEWFNDAFYVPS